MSDSETGSEPAPVVVASPPRSARRTRVIVEISATDSSASEEPQPEPKLVLSRRPARTVARSPTVSSAEEACVNKGRSQTRKGGGILTPTDLSPDDEVVNVKSRCKIAGFGECFLVKLKRRGWVRVSRSYRREGIGSFALLGHGQRACRVPGAYGRVRSSWCNGRVSLFRSFEHDNPRAEVSTDEEDVPEEDYAAASQEEASEENSEGESEEEDFSRRRTRSRGKPKKALKKPKLKMVVEPTRRSSRATRNQQAYADEDALRSEPIQPPSSDESESASEVEVATRLRPVSKKPLLDMKTKMQIDDDEEEDASAIDAHKAVRLPPGS
jgi:hypothetical protein